MPLYDNYRLSNSTAIPEFAGSMLPDLKWANTELNKRYDYALGNITNTGNAIQDAPVNPLDAEEYQKFYSNVQGKLKEISQRPDLENIVPATQELARQTARQLKPFVTSNAAWQSALQTLNSKDLNLSASTKALKIAKMADDYRKKKDKFTINPTTGAIEGGFTFDGFVAKELDLPGWVDKTIKDAVTHKYGTEGYSHSADGRYLVKRDDKWETLSQEEIDGYLKSAYNLSPDVQADINQRSSLSGWSIARDPKAYSRMPDRVPDPEHKGHTMANPMKVAVDQLVHQGMPLRDAIETVVTRNNSSSIYDSMRKYASKYVKNDHMQTEDKSVDSFALADYQAKTKEAPILFGNGLTIGNGPMTSDQLKGTISKLGIESGNLESTISGLDSKLTQLRKNFPNDPSINQLETDLNNARARLNANRELKAAYETTYRRSLNDATQSLFNSGHINRGSYEEIKADVRGQIKAEVEKGIHGTKLMTKKGKVLTSAEITEAVMDHRYEYMAKGGGIIVDIPGKGSITIAGKSTWTPYANKPANTNPLDRAISSMANSNLGKVQKEAKRLYDANPKSVQISTVSIPKDLEEAAVRIVNQQPHFDMAGTPVPPPKEFTKIETPAETTSGMAITRYTDADGKVTSYMTDMSQSGLRNLQSIRMSRSADPDIRRAANDMMPGSGGNLMLKMLPANGEVHKVGGAQLKLDTGDGLKNVFFANRGKTYGVYYEGSQKPVMVKAGNGKMEPLLRNDMNVIGDYFQQAIYNSNFK